VKEQIQSVGCPACGQVGVVAQEIGKYPSGKIKYQQVTCPECKGAKQVRRKVLVPDFS
jgi:ssDNA-binding Zn-finger/Zn-ribbon topoisomerase 1